MNQFENNFKIVFGYPLLLLILMWSFYLMDYTSRINFFEFGIYPRTFSGLMGIFFSPLIHSQEDLKHIFSNSVPLAVLLASLIHFYKSIALKVFASVWILGGTLTWLIARDNYHIGMSGVIYGLVAFLFVSGALRKYKPLMGLSLFVVFLYGSLIWGIFPLEAKISWEGHISGLLVGVVMAFLYRKQGPQSPKFVYEIEKDLGIEPVDYERLWREQLAKQEDNLLQEGGLMSAQDESIGKQNEPLQDFTYTYVITPSEAKHKGEKTERHK